MDTRVISSEEEEVRIFLKDLKGVYQIPCL